jgi:flavin reductase (DIM6/NTAB) family NADH-FMN oxidoreductase RutF
MTIHSSHPFPSEPDPVRRLRGRLGGAVTLWTSGGPDERTGLTVTSVLVAGGEPGRIVGLLDPDADLTERLLASRTGVVQLLSWRHRDLADAFAGVAPAPGGAWRLGEWTETPAGPRLDDAAGWAEVQVEQEQGLGWSTMVVCTIGEIELAEDDDEPLVHRRGRYLRSGP